MHVCNVDTLYALSELASFCFRPWASAQLRTLQQLLRLVRGSVLEPPSDDELVALLLEVSLVFDRGNQLSGLEVEHSQELAASERFEAARDLVVGAPELHQSRAALERLEASIQVVVAQEEML